MTCILHSSTSDGTIKTTQKQTGVKKTDYILPLPEISLCTDENRRKRCIHEPNCDHIKCLRKCQNLLQFQNNWTARCWWRMLKVKCASDKSRDQHQDLAPTLWLLTQKGLEYTVLYTFSIPTFGTDICGLWSKMIGNDTVWLKFEALKKEYRIRRWLY